MDVPIGTLEEVGVPEGCVRSVDHPNVPIGTLGVDEAFGIFLGNMF